MLLKRKKEKKSCCHKKNVVGPCLVIFIKNDVSLNSYLINNEVIIPQLKHLYYVPYGTGGTTDSVRSLIRKYNNENRETLGLILKSFYL